MWFNELSCGIHCSACIGGSGKNHKINIKILDFLELLRKKSWQNVKNIKITDCAHKTISFLTSKIIENTIMQ
jgi:hypothetical protein